MRKRQYEAEKQSDEEAVATRLAALRSKALKGDITLPRALHVLTATVGRVEEYLKAWTDTTLRGRGAKYKRWWRALSPEVAACICVRTCMQTLASSPNGVTLQRLASQIGKLVELEVRIGEARRVNPLYVKKALERVRRSYTKSTSHIRRSMNKMYTKIMQGEMDSTLAPSEYLQLGKVGVQACIDAGLLEQVRTVGSKGLLVLFQMAPDVFNFLIGYGSKDVRTVTDLNNLPMLCPPDPWETLGGGGYLTEKRKALFQAVTWGEMRPKHRRELRETLTAESAPEVFGVLNYLQSIPFEIHVPTLTAIERLYASGGGVMGVPPREYPEKPPCPFGEAWKASEATPEEQEVFEAWMMRVRAWHVGVRAHRNATATVLGLVRNMRNIQGPCWYPVFMDGRGRWYYRAKPNPQGDDMSKASLHFHEKRALGSDGLFWMQVQLANSLGYDKAPLRERADWVQQNWQAFENALDAPEDYPDVWGDDSPWCAFSAAWEIREALRSGDPKSYRTGLVVHQDASASGLQHFSAMLRDSVGAAAVNLVGRSDGGPKMDIYTAVAEAAMRSVEADINGPKGDIARWWLRNPISRKIAKKPVMTYVYGATLRGTAQFIEETFAVDGWPEAPPEGVGTFAVVLYAATKLFEGVEATVPAAAEGMRWLRRISAQKGKEALSWTTPLGFKVIQDYPEYTQRRVHVHSCGLQLVLMNHPTDKLDRRRMSNAIAPNFVHSLDASHMGFTALAMRDAGHCLVGIHDSFGTHPSSVREMRNCIRSTFRRMYEGNDVLEQLVQAVQSEEEAPEKGALDLSGVETSEFMIS